MPVIYPKSIRRKFSSLNLDKVKDSLINNGYKFIRDGGYRHEDEPFKFSNYLFYKHPETQVAVRIGYNYPIIGTKNIIFEICYAKSTDNWWRDVTPDFSKNIWKKVSDWYEKNENGKFVKKYII
ncbi:hypothetical protein IKN40_01015 [bacterium]|nr:hypothetical protein [bacterium]